MSRVVYIFAFFLLTTIFPASVFPAEGADADSIPSISLKSDSIMNHPDSTVIFCEGLDLKDSVYSIQKQPRVLTYKLSKELFYKKLYLGVPLIVSGFLFKSADDDFKGFRDQYAREFKYPHDNWAQYSPAVAMLAMKAFGVKSRSSWKRMIVSDAFSVALMAGVVNTIKHSVDRLRPDGSNYHSFPSGHTATAFMCATMLHKEYGHISPWISVGGYTIATATGISRILNNKHWASDVLVGAGIGTITTNIGYFLADLIFKDKGLAAIEIPERYGRWHKPSFVGLSTGYCMSGTKFNSKYGEVSLKLGISAAIEGAYFITPYIGVGGKCGLTNMPVKIDERVAAFNLEMNSICAGLYLSYPFSSIFHVSAKAIGGFCHYSKCVDDDIKYFGGNHTMTMSLGGALVFMTSKAFNVKAFCDYNLAGSFIDSSDKMLNSVTIGGTFAVNF